MTQLPRKPLFADGPEVSRLCLGTMMFGDQTDKDEAGRILDAFLEAGGDFIDTADQYAGGRSEEFLGRLLHARSAECFVATKVGNKVAGDAQSGGISAAWIATAVERSRARLGREVIDLYYLHLDDNETPLEETIGALGALISQGAIRHWGFSNFRSWKIAEMVRVADHLGVPRPVAAQPYYHMLNRMPEIDYLPACQHFGIGVVPYSPLARGVLTGKYRGGDVPEGSRAARADPRMMETEFRPETLEVATQAVAHADATGRDPAGLAVQWVLANQIVTSVLVGPRTEAQMRSYLDAAQVGYGAKDEMALSALCASGHTPVVGYADPRYPFRGRVTTFGDAA